MIKIENQPYEILIRFAPDGQIGGAHWKALKVITENDKMLSTSETIETLQLPDGLANELKSLMAKKLADLN